MNKYYLASSYAFVHGQFSFFCVDLDLVLHIAQLYHNCRRPSQFSSTDLHACLLSIASYVYNACVFIDLIAPQLAFNHTNMQINIVGLNIYQLQRHN